MLATYLNKCLSSHLVTVLAGVHYEVLLIYCYIVLAHQSIPVQGKAVSDMPQL